MQEQADYLVQQQVLLFQLYTLVKREVHIRAQLFKASLA